MIEKLVGVLRAAKLEPTAEELADAIWLATVAGPMTGIVDAAPRPTTPTNTNSASNDPMPAEKPNDRDRLASDTGTRVESGTPAGELHQAVEHSSSAATTKRGVAVASPTASALPGALDLARALRPLKRRVASRLHYEVDEEATAQRIAERAAEPIVLRPQRTRWLNLTLLVDEGPSMPIWQQTARELYSLISGHGAFGYVRRCSFNAESSGKPYLFVRSGQGRRAVGAKELIDPAGRQLLLVLSDCVSEGWRNGRMASLLDVWSRRGPVGLLQVLPPRLWHRSGLGAAIPVRVHADHPAAANMQLLVERDAWWSADDFALGAPAPLPVFSLERTSFQAWASMIAGRAGESVGGVMLYGAGDSDKPERTIDDKPERTIDDDVIPDARALVAHFRATSSLKAQKLATYFASAHYLSLPVMRLIQRTMVPDATLGHLAEVFLAGLLLESGIDSGDPEYTRYHFVDGVRDFLLGASDEQSIRKVLTAVSDYATAHLGHKTSFRAILADPTAGSSEIIPEQEASFARIGADILRRLGGEYEQIADRIGARLYAGTSGTSPDVYRFEPKVTVGGIVGEEKLIEYVREYESIRNHSPSSPVRTMQLDRIFEEIKSYAVEAHVPTAIALDAFHRNSEGMRIVALAILDGNPDPAGFEVIRDAIADPRSPFEQFHALLVALKILSRLSLPQKIALRNAIVYQRSGVPGTTLHPESDRWWLGEELLQHFDAPHQIVLILDIAPHSVGAVEKSLPSKYSHRTIIKLSDYGVAHSTDGESLDWHSSFVAFDSVVDTVRGVISTENLHPHIYLLGQAPLAVLLQLGRRLPRVEVTVYDGVRLDAGPYLHINLEGSPEMSGRASTVPSSNAGDRRDRVVVTVNIDRPIPRASIERLLAKHYETLTEVLEIRFEEQLATLGPTVRSTLAAIQLDNGFSRAAAYGNRLALFIDGPAALAFLAGRALDAYDFRDVWVYNSMEIGSGKDPSDTNPLHDDDAEADDAVAVLERYWQLGIELSEIMAEWDACCDKSAGFERMQGTLQGALEDATSVRKRIQVEPMAKYPCGQEIETAHVQYIVAQVEYLHAMLAWSTQHRDRLRKLMVMHPLNDVILKFRRKVPVAICGYERIMSVETTKRLFQCGPPDNVAWINKVAVRLGLGPDKLGGGPLRVRSTQRIIQPLGGGNLIDDESGVSPVQSAQRALRVVRRIRRATEQAATTEKTARSLQPADRRALLHMANYFRFHADYETSEHAGAGGMFQVITIEDDAGKDVTSILGIDGTHYSDAESLKRDIAQNLGIGIDTFDLEETD